MNLYALRDTVWRAGWSTEKTCGWPEDIAYVGKMEEAKDNSKHEFDGTFCNSPL